MYRQIHEIKTQVAEEKTIYLAKFYVPSLRIIKNMNVTYNNLFGLLRMDRALRQKEQA